MVWYGSVATCLCLCVVHATFAVKVKVVLHSQELEDSRQEEEFESERWERNKVTMLPFVTRHNTPATHHERTTVAPLEPRTSHSMHPNDLVFPLIYRQGHINGMFKFGANWYTWSTEKRLDGSNGVSYYICYDEPKRCDDVGWERTDSVPKCAFQIDSVLADDRACINPFGVEPHVVTATAGPDSTSPGTCDGAEQMKVNDIVHACGPRLRSLWRFVRVGRRPPAAPKPADVNSLLCDDEEECYITIEYKIHHDRITFSLHEPTRGQTFKSVLKRESNVEEEHTTERRQHVRERHENTHDDQHKFHVKVKSKPTAEGKGVMKERNDERNARRSRLNKLKLRGDTSEDISD